MVCGIKNLTQTRKDKASVPYPVAYPGFSKGGARKFEIMKTKRKIFALRISSFSGLKLREDRKKKSSLKISPVFGPKLREDQKKQVFTQILSFCVLKLSAQVTKGGHAAILHTILC